MAEIIHGRQYGTLSANSACWKTHRKELKIWRNKYQNNLGSVGGVLHCWLTLEMFPTCVILGYMLDCFNSETHSELLFCESLQERCIRVDSIVNYFVNRNNVLWENCASVHLWDFICNLYTGILLFFIPVKAVTPQPHVKFFHRIIHR